MLKSNVSNVTAPMATMATVARAATTATMATAATATTTTSSLKMTSTTSVLVTLAFMNSTVSNTTKLQLPVAHTIDTQPNCYRQQIECPFSRPSVRYGPVDKHTQAVGDYVSSSIKPLQLITTRPKLSTLVDLGHSPDFGHGSNFGPTTGLFSENRNGTGWTESTTETTFKTVDDVKITAEVVYYDEKSSSENTVTTVESDVSYTHNYDEMMENFTVDMVTTELMTENSTRDLVTDGSTITSSTDVSFDFRSTTPGSISSSIETTSIGGTTPVESTVESTTSVVTESTTSLDTVVIMENTTIGQSIITVDDDDEPYSTISSEDFQFWPTDENIASAEERRIVKRMSELIFNGTHCFQIVCSPPSPVTKYVTEVPNGFQGFSEKSSKYQSLYSYT